MGLDRPFYRTVRGPYTDYSGWAYIKDADYAERPDRYIRPLELLQKDLLELFKYVEPSDACLKTYSFRIHELLMRVCIEVEVNFRAILAANSFTKQKDKSLNITHYRLVDVSHHLSSYEITLPIWDSQRSFKPYERWLKYRCHGVPKSQQSCVSLDWYRAYNESKHDRISKFEQANFGNLVDAFCGLLVLLTAQFRTEDFSPRKSGIALSGGEFENCPKGFEETIGEVFCIKYPSDWNEEELYAFDWNSLKNTNNKFQKFDYDAVWENWT